MSFHALALVTCMAALLLGFGTLLLSLAQDRLSAYDASYLELASRTWLPLEVPHVEED